jgi:hypothetical protein
MTHPDIAAAFVRERSRTLMAEAEAVRRARQAATSSKLVPRGHYLAGIQRLLAGRAGAKKSMSSCVTRSASSWWTQCEASGRRSTRSRLGTSS